MKKMMKKARASVFLALIAGATCHASAGETYGLGEQTKLIHASQFKSHSAQCPLANPLAGYWHVVAIPGASCTQQIGVQYGAIFSAQLELPEGSAIHSLDIYYTRGANDDPLTFGLMKYTAQPGGGNSTGNNWTYGSMNTPASSSSSKAASMSFPANYVVFNSYDRASNVIQIYEVEVAMVASNWAGFLGAAIHYNRQIAPAPAAASYADIPTSHPFFNEIEQLKKSGITLGCGGGNFCPDSPVTRGQMAAFLSRAFGLNWDTGF